MAPIELMFVLKWLQCARLLRTLPLRLSIQAKNELYLFFFLLSCSFDYQGIDVFLWGSAFILARLALESLCTDPYNPLRSYSAFEI